MSTIVLLSSLLLATSIAAIVLASLLVAARLRIVALRSAEEELRALRTEIVTERDRRSLSDVELARMQERLAALQRGEEERSAVLRSELEALAQRIFEEKTGRFKEIGTSAISELVAPVRDNLETLRKALADSETRDALREQSLREAIERVGQINARLGDQADDLARALKGDNKLVGDFGEVILGRLLEYAGLRQGVNFVEQGIDLDLRGESGGRLMPDVVVFLPENRCLVVDSKMSLKSWMEAQSADEEARRIALDDFRRSVRAHIDDLASKSYTEALVATGRGSVEFKFLFIPVEAAFHACLQLDRSLYQYAFDRKIILTSPTTLLAVLTTVNHTWKQFEIGRNAEAIRDRASLLLDKLHDFLGSMDKVGEQLGKAQDAYETARKRLSSGTGNLVRQAELLKELKVGSSKALPRSFESSRIDDESN